MGGRYSGGHLRSEHGINSVADIYSIRLLLDLLKINNLIHADINIEIYIFQRGKIDALVKSPILAIFDDVNY